METNEKRKQDNLKRIEEGLGIGQPKDEFDILSLTDEERKEAVTVATFWADSLVDKKRDLLKWSTLYDEAYQRKYEQLRPEALVAEQKTAFKQWMKDADIEHTLFKVFQAGIHYEKERTEKEK